MRGVWVVEALVVVLAMSGAAACGRHHRPPSLTIKVLQYNVQGAVRDVSSTTGLNGASDDDDFRFVGVLANRIIAERPQIVTLEEVCTSQLSRLTSALRASYPMTVAAKELHTHVDCPLSENAPPESRADGIGQAILTVGAAQPLPVPPGVRLVCAQWEQIQSIRVCAAHVNPLPAPDVPALAAVVNRMTDDSPVIVTGDFNATPSQDTMSPLYAPTVAGGTTPSTGRFWELNMCDQPPAAPSCPVNGTGATRAGPATWCGVCIDGTPTGIYTRKLDYIFADVRHFAPRMDARVEDTERACGATRCSDHAMVWGELTLEHITPPPTTPANGCGTGEQKWFAEYSRGMAPEKVKLLACQHGLIAVTDPLSRPWVFRDAEPFGSASAIAYNPESATNNRHCEDVMDEIKRAPAILKAIGC